MDNSYEESSTSGASQLPSPVFNTTVPNRPVNEFRFPSFTHPRFPSPRHNMAESNSSNYSQLINRIEQLERENLSLKEKINNDEAASSLLHLHSSQMREQSNPRYTVPEVKVVYPSQPPRLGIFTGLKPAGGSEVDFAEWSARCKSYLCESEGNDSRDVLRKVRSSLRGIALEQVKDCSSASSIIDTLKQVYGNLLTEEDQYVRFVKLAQEKRESPASYFSRLWSSFSDLNQRNQYSAMQANSKIYHTFMTNFVSNDNFLLIELRSKFGTPGETAPNCSSVLAFLRSYMERPSQKTFAAHAAANTVESPVSPPDINYDKLADIMIEKMKLSSTPPSIPPTNPPPEYSHNVPRSQGMMRKNADLSNKPCFNCGELGHLQFSCVKPPNPAKVKAAKQRMQARSLNGR